MSDAETLDRLAAYAKRRAAEWSRDMDCEQAIEEPSDKCEVTIWELQGLIEDARRTVPGLVQYNQERDRAEAAERAFVAASRDLAQAREVLRQLEWRGPHGSGGVRTCLRCGAYESDGHAELCDLAAARKGST